MLERLQKIISAAGITSRRAAEELILAGRVSVNGTVVTELGSKADPASDTVAVDGKPLVIASKKLYILLNKPVGYLTTLDDPEGRPLVTDLLKEVGERVYPVGRLDYNTEGLLLLTSDGEWANQLMHPRHEVEKEYHVRVRGKVHKSQLDQLAGGVDIDGRKTAPARVCMIKEGEQNDWFSITIHEGRNRQVRRMCEAVSLSVVRLRRVRYGMLSMGAMKPGEFRFLTEAEVEGLRNPHQKQAAAPLKTPAAHRPAGSARAPQQPLASTRPAHHKAAGKQPGAPIKKGPPGKP
jgi:23S rRNA pseudouridine2605 synthase